ncbi:hypothetical protein JZ751_026747, partial [Albula glossodonta]
MAVDICLSQLPTIIEEGTAFRGRVPLCLNATGGSTPQETNKKKSKRLKRGDQSSPIHYTPAHSPFFAEQLTAFQVWLTMGVENRNPPEQLPIVLQ